MKRKISILLIALTALISCEEELVIYDVENGQSVVAFNGATTVDLPITAEGESTLDVEVGVTTVSDSDRTYSVTVDPSSTADPSQYSVGETVTIPAGGFSGGLTVTGVFETVPDGVSNTLILNLNEPSEGRLGDRDQVTVNLFRFCPSEIAAEFTWVASNFVYQGTPLGDGGNPSGTDAFIDDDGDGQYDIASGFWDFGFYCTWYLGADPGCGAGASGSLQLKEVCGRLSFVGADQYGDPWEIFNISTNGPELRFTFLSGFGEQADVVLTRTDGEDWPTLSE